MEILVVVFIIALVAGIGIPGFARAIEGQKLRAAARAVATAHKYARNMAVLKQMPMAVVIRGDAGTVEVQSIRDRNRLPPGGMFLDNSAAMGGAPADLAAPPGSIDTNIVVEPELDTEFVKSFPADIVVEDFQLKQDEKTKSDRRRKRDDSADSGVYVALYHANGMSDGMTVRLTDGKRRYATIATDPLSGDVELEFETTR